MQKVLGRKQNIANQDWIDAFNRIEELVSREEIEELTAETVKQIEAMTQGKKAAYAWSGGKDSLVLEHICKRAGINESVLAVCDLEYPAFIEWIEKFKPDGLEIINTKQDIEWLKKHENFLFPQKSDVASQWFHIVQHRAQAKFYKEHELDMILLGRRRADGNYVGRQSNIYTDGKGVTRYSPLSDWSHEAVLAFIKYYEVPMPPIYDWVNGYLCGTHPWPARQWTGSMENGWKEVYEIDHSIVENAAEQFESAKAFLESIQ